LVEIVDELNTYDNELKNFNQETSYDVRYAFQSKRK